MMSLEVHGIIRWLAATGVPFKVTDVDTPGVHATNSYHYAEGTGGRGLAVDVAGLTPSVASPALRAIVDALRPVEGRLVEFLHPWNRADHQDHVHVAVPRGTILEEEGTSMIPDHKKIVVAFPYESGYVMVTADGAVYCFGCDYRGGLRWDGQAWVLR